MVEKDYIMRLIHEMVRTVIKLLISRDMDKNEEIVFKDIETKMKYDRLLKLIDDGNVNEAENKLLDELNTENMHDFQLTLMFYDYLNEKDDAFLEEHDFSRKEVSDGIKHVANLYGYENMVGVLLGTLYE